MVTPGNSWCLVGLFNFASKQAVAYNHRVQSKDNIKSLQVCSLMPESDMVVWGLRRQHPSRVHRRYDRFNQYFVYVRQTSSWFSSWFSGSVKSRERKRPDLSVTAFANSGNTSMLLKPTERGSRNPTLKGCGRSARLLSFDELFCGTDSRYVSHECLSRQMPQLGGTTDQTCTLCTLTRGILKCNARALNTILFGYIAGGPKAILDVLPLWINLMHLDAVA